MSDSTPLPSSFTKTEVGFALRCSEKKVERLIRDGALEGHRIGNRILISRASVERLLGAQTFGPSSASSKAAGR